MSSDRGQSLIEMVIVIAVLLFVVSALAFAVISGIRNADFAKNSAQASKYSQEGLERVRAIRDRDQEGGISYTGPPTLTRFSQLYGISFICPTNCYFKFTESGVLLGVTSADFEAISNFKRQILIEDAGSDQKKVTALVEWQDSSGRHASRVTTILRRL